MTVRRTGRFVLQLDGRRLTVLDSGGEQASIRAKLSEWIELAQAILNLKTPGGPSGNGGTSSKLSLRSQRRWIPCRPKPGRG